MMVLSLSRAMKRVVCAALCALAFFFTATPSHASAQNVELQEPMSRAQSFSLSRIGFSSRRALNLRQEFGVRFPNGFRLGAFIDVGMGHDVNPELGGGLRVGRDLAVLRSGSFALELTPSLHLRYQRIDDFGARRNQFSVGVGFALKCVFRDRFALVTSFEAEYPLGATAGARSRLGFSASIGFEIRF